MRAPNLLEMLVTLFPPTPTARMVLQGVLQELSYRIASFAMRNVCVVELRCSDSDKMVRGRQRMTTVSRGSRTTGSVARSVARSRPSRLYRDRRAGGWRPRHASTGGLSSTSRALRRWPLRPCTTRVHGATSLHDGMTSPGVVAT